MTSRYILTSAHRDFSAVRAVWCSWHCQIGRQRKRSKIEKQQCRSGKLLDSLNSTQTQLQ